MNQPRIEEYLDILRKNSVYQQAAKKCLTRLNNPEDQMYVVLWAPALMEYVEWVIRQAVTDRKKRLYFLSRDAYPMYLAAQKLIQALGLDMECRYLRVSRSSLRMPEYHLMGEKCLDRIFLSGIDVSLYQILQRVNLSEQEMAQFCEEIHYRWELKQVLNRKQILELKEQVIRACRNKKTQFLHKIFEKSEGAYQPAIGYLKQEGLLDHVSYAVVDSGWVGTIQKSIHTLLAKENPNIRVDGYYFGLYEIPIDHTGCHYQAYYFMPKGDLRRKARFSNCLFEVMYSEPCAMVQGYRYENGLYRPVFSGQVNPNGIELERNSDLIEIYTQEVIAAKKNSSHKKGTVSEALYSKLMSAPNEWEADYYGRWLFSDDISEAYMKNTANTLTQQDIRNLRSLSKLGIMLGLSKKVIHESAWIEGSIVNAKENKKKNLRAARRAKYLTHLRQSLRSNKIRKK